jgi:hypothetical protein
MPAGRPELQRAAATWGAAAAAACRATPSGTAALRAVWLALRSAGPHEVTSPEGKYGIDVRPCINP